MRKTLTFLAGILTGFLVLAVLLRLLPFSYKHMGIIVNAETGDFLTALIHNRPFAEHLTVGTFYFINALVVCAPFGIGAGVLLSRIRSKRLFVYPILLSPILHIAKETYSFKTQLSLGLRHPMQYILLDYHVMGVVISYAVFFAFLYMSHSRFTKRRKNQAHAIYFSPSSPT